MSAAHSSLLQTAIQNLQISQQAKDRDRDAQSSINFGSPPSDHFDLPSEDESEADEFVNVGQGTRPPTRPGSPSPRKVALRPDASRLSDAENSLDPLTKLPTVLAVRVLLQLDIKSLARCERVCKRWKKSNTINHVWYLQNRALLIPDIPIGGNGKSRKLDDGTEFFDPFDKTPRISALPTPRMPSSSTLVWTKTESRTAWKKKFHHTLKRSDPNAEPEYDPLRVDISSLHTSGATTPSGRPGHAHAGLGSGNAARWAEVEAASGTMTPGERKNAARAVYKSMGGRKARGKNKPRDEGISENDPRFTSPF